MLIDIEQVFPGQQMKTQAKYISDLRAIVQANKEGPKTMTEAIPPPVTVPKAKISVVQAPKKFNVCTWSKIFTKSICKKRELRFKL